MVIKVLIKRKIVEGKAREVFALLNQFRADAMNQVGYISGETLINHDDPQEVLVISKWQGIENWLKWKDDPNRQANEAKMKLFLEGFTTYDTYVLGTYFTQFDKK